MLFGLFPYIPVAYAVSIDTFVQRVIDLIIQPTVSLMMAVAVFIFIWGLAQFLGNQDSEEIKKTGKQHMLYGLIGLVIMLSAFGIMRLIKNTLGLKAPPGADIEFYTQ